MVWVSRSDSKAVLLMLDPSIGLTRILPPLAVDGFRDRPCELRLTGIAACHLAGVTDELAGPRFPPLSGPTNAARTTRQRRRGPYSRAQRARAESHRDC